ncbi:hypothetical protein ASE41_10605 [Streptomyces sp. Root264]|nr:hypothetical protein ASE41_10605 [Streptomyces sp. Root264]
MFETLRTGRKGWVTAERHRRPVAPQETYREAEHAGDHPSDHGFPVERVAITGRDVCGTSACASG